jgi:hypothetical protein
MSQFEMEAIQTREFCVADAPRRARDFDTWLRRQAASQLRADRADPSLRNIGLLRRLAQDDKQTEHAPKI